jgi:hypothetical protein
LNDSNIKESLKITGIYWTREDNHYMSGSALFYDFDEKGSWSNPQSTYYRVICVNGP